MTIDVWPDLDWSKAIRTPRTVLLEQSEILKRKSRGALRLEVLTDSEPKNAKFPDGVFRNSAYIVSLRLSYSMPLLTINHPVSEPYPAALIEEGDKQEKVVDGEEQLLKELQAILNKPKWIESISRLIAMGNSQ